MFSRRTSWGLVPNHLTRALNEARRSGKKILDLTISNPTRAALASDETAILDPLCNPKALDYDPHPKGLLQAREAVTDYYAELGHDIAPESVVLTSGTSEGYAFAFRLLADPGDEILVPKPSYPLFDFLADIEDVKLSSFPLIYDHGWQIDFHSLEKVVNNRTRAIVLVHPNNPTGSYVNEKERERLNELCRRNNLALIVDEVFLDYAHDGRCRPSFASNNTALTFTLSGISKISALPQIKLAWIVASGPASLAVPALERIEIIADTFLSVSTPVQWAAASLLEQRKNIQPQIKTRIRNNLAELERQLAKQKACSRLSVEGGWYVVIRVPAIRSDEELAIELLQKHGVLVHPGHFYDFPQDGFLVLSLITPEAEFRDGISQVLEVFSE